MLLLAVFSTIFAGLLGNWITFLLQLNLGTIWNFFPLGNLLAIAVMGGFILHALRNKG